MSRLWREDSGAQPVRVATLGLSGAAGLEVFAPWNGIERRAFAGTMPGHAETAAAPCPVATLEDLRAVAFAEGLAEGRRVVEAELAAERAALATLADSLECCRPEAPQALAGVLAEVVTRLVQQVVGEIEVGEVLIRERVDTVARLIAEQAGPARMRLHPDDIVRLGRDDFPFPLIADAGLMPGSVIVETASGWIEDGAEVGMERLRQALDQLAMAR